KDHQVVYFKSGIIPYLQNKVNALQPAITPETAFQNALNILQIAPSSITLQSQIDTANSYLYNCPDLSDNLVKIQLVYREYNNNVLLAWDVSFEMKNEPHWWNVRIIALTG